MQVVASGAALSLMGGAVTVHYVHVREVSSAYLEESGDGTTGQGLELVSMETSGDLLGIGSRPAERLEDSRTPADPPAGSEREVTLELLQSMVDQIESLSKENRRLREEQSQLADQVAETNRDLSQLQFRVDTHSESFRPLRVNEDSSLRAFKPAHPVLPPKDWSTTPPSGAGWHTAGQ